MSEKLGFDCTIPSHLKSILWSGFDQLYLQGRIESEVLVGIATTAWFKWTAADNTDKIKK